MKRKFEYIVEATIAYLFIGLSVGLAIKLYMKQFIGFLINFTGMMTLTIINKYFRENNVVIFNKIDIVWYGTFILALSMLLILKSYFNV